MTRSLVADVSAEALYVGLLLGPTKVPNLLRD